MASGGCIVPELDAFQSQSVSRECIARFLGDELLEDFASRLLRIRHGDGPAL